jgi:hypothetical protein
MGASLVYLEKPNKDIQFEHGENGNLKYVAAGMQGWRINMVRPKIQLEMKSNTPEFQSSPWRLSSKLTKLYDLYLNFGQLYISFEEPDSELNAAC